MRIISYPVGQLQANCYFVIKDDDCLIFDPGDSADFLLEEIQRLKLKPKALFATHGHFDHLMAVGEIQMSFNIPFYIAKEDLFLVKRVGETARYFLGHEPYIVKPTSRVILSPPKAGEESQKFSLKILKTPGHTPGSVCYYFKKQGWLLTGDTLFKGAIGRYDFSYSNKEDLYVSIHDTLFKLPEETIVYPGHAEKTTIGQEKKVMQI